MSCCKSGIFALAIAIFVSACSTGGGSSGDFGSSGSAFTGGGYADAGSSKCYKNSECDDDNAKNGVETCVAGKCEPGTPPNCDDGNPCTNDDCDKKGCTHTDWDKDCDDGNGCTTGDHCWGQKCIGKAKSCDDGDECTLDSCADGKCQHKPSMTAACCPSDIDLAILNKYNLFACGEYIVGDKAGGTDVQGRVAVGEKVYLRAFSIATTHQGGDALTCGGKVDIANGTVYGNVVYGGSATIASNATISAGGKAIHGSPIDFKEVCEELSDSCHGLGSLKANGKTTISAFHEITVSGSDDELNVFNLKGSDLSQAASFAINVPAGSTAIINVDGSSCSIHNFAFFLGKGVKPEHVIFNFDDASKIEIDQAGVEGSIFAPHATISFNNGQINGSIVCKNLYGNGEFHEHTCGASVHPKCW